MDLENKITSTVADEIQKMVKEVSLHRDRIKEDFCKAYLATFLSDDTNIDELIKGVELVEKWSGDRMKVSWYFRWRE